MENQADKILEVAFDELDKFGIVDFSISTVATKAKCSKTTLYNLVAGKNDVLLQIYKQRIEGRLNFSLCIYNDVELNPFEKLVAFFLYIILKEQHNPNRLGMHVLPSCKLLWSFGSEEAVSAVMASLKKVHQVPINIMDLILTEYPVTPMSSTDKKLLMVKLLAVERGYVTVLNNIEINEVAKQISLVEISERLLFELKMVGWDSDLVDVDKTLAWLQCRNEISVR